MPNSRSDAQVRQLTAFAAAVAILVPVSYLVIRYRGALIGTPAGNLQ